MADKNKNKDNLPPNFPPKKNKPRFSFYWIYAVLAAVFIGIQIFNYTSPQKETTWNQLYEMLEKQDIEKIVIVNKEKAEIYIKKDRIAKDTAYKDFIKKSFSTSFGDNPQYFYNIGSDENFRDLMKGAQDTISAKMLRANKTPMQVAQFRKQYPYPPSLYYAE